MAVKYSSVLWDHRIMQIKRSFKRKQSIYTLTNTIRLLDCGVKKKGEKVQIAEGGKNEEVLSSLMSQLHSYDWRVWYSFGM